MIKGEESRLLPLKNSHMKFLILTSERFSQTGDDIKML